jgi:D-alanyl-D-alanine carboxypeptidase/D-alanyl-D-alanine-endopeptidase (penicillin-binding protein 4)
VAVLLAGGIAGVPAESPKERPQQPSQAELAAARVISLVDTDWSPPLAASGATVLESLQPQSELSATAAGLAAVLDPLLGGKEFGPSVGAAVVDVSSGRLLYGKEATTGLVPASTTKILTAVAALSTVGPDTRLTTRVVLASPVPPPPSPADPGPGAPPTTPSAPAKLPPADVVLVGGGDPTLTVQPRGSRALAGHPDEARLDVLASRTAAALNDLGVSSVRLRYDDSLFSGPVTADSWRSGYVIGGIVARITALTVDEARVHPFSAARVRDPSYDAARRFARLLAARGINLTGPVGAGEAPVDAQQLAAVQSAPMASLVERMLADSDNDLAEALARQVAHASDQPVTFGGAAGAIVAGVGKLGVDVAGVQLYDGSGLSRSNRIPPAAVARTLAVAAAPDRPELRAAVSGLAVAGFDGTLSERFLRSPAKDAVGLVRAKTGTLSGVHSLAGVVPDSDGHLLAFSFVADRIPGGSAGKARATLDALAAALARCGCS